MKLAQKNRIIKRSLQEQSVDPSVVNLKDHDLVPFASFSALLAHIGDHHARLFDLTTMEADPGQWRQLTNLINAAASFTKGSPSMIQRISLESASQGIRCLQNKLTSPQFTSFLDTCIQRAGSATNHLSAQRESLTLSDDANEAIRQLNALQVPILAQLLAAEPEVQAKEIDPFATLMGDLDLERSVLMEPHRAAVMDPQASADTLVTHSKITPVKGITV